MKINKLFKKYENKIDTLDLELITAHVTRKSREFLVAHPEQNTTFTQQYTINKLIKKREKGIPLAYLLGKKEFFGLDFKVNKHTLIPRPETELMVSLVLDEIKRLKDYKIILVDVGTGTGCIPVSIIKSSNLPIFQSYATDISKPALRIAKKNAKTHNVNIKFLHGNLLSPITKQLQQLQQLEQLQHLIITANLPYITEEQFANEPSIQHEPKSALVAENKGLALYEELLEQIVRCKMSREHLCPGADVRCFFEIDPDQAKPIIPLIKKHLPNANVEIKKDLSGLDRMVKIDIHNKS